MTFTAMDVVKILGVIVSLAALVWGVVSYLNRRIDRTRTHLHQDVEKLRQYHVDSENHVHGRINEVRNDFVKKSDLDRDMQRIDRSLENISQEQGAVRQEFSSQFQRIHELLHQVVQNSSHRE